MKKRINEIQKIYNEIKIGNNNKSEESIDKEILENNLKLLKSKNNSSNDFSFSTKDKKQMKKKYLLNFSKSAKSIATGIFSPENFDLNNNHNNDSTIKKGEANISEFEVPGFFLRNNTTEVKNFNLNDTDDENYSKKFSNKVKNFLIV
jgi:hypothetical protein